MGCFSIGPEFRVKAFHGQVFRGCPAAAFPRGRGWLAIWWSEALVHGVIGIWAPWFKSFSGAAQIIYYMHSMLSYSISQILTCQAQTPQRSRGRLTSFHP